MTLAPGTPLGPYEIVSELGHGGMGVVYEARDPRLKRTVAIKLLPPDLTKDDTAKQRFLQEAQAASALDHPNICMGRPSRFSPEVRERAVRMVEEHRATHASEWGVLQSVAPKLGCTAETLRKWVRQAQRDAGYRPGLTTSERERLKELEREVRELKRANEILRKASAYFAQAELDRRGK